MVAASDSNRDVAMALQNEVHGNDDIQSTAEQPDVPILSPDDNFHGDAGASHPQLPTVNNSESAAASSSDRCVECGLGDLPATSRKCRRKDVQWVHATLVLFVNSKFISQNAVFLTPCNAPLAVCTVTIFMLFCFTLFTYFTLLFYAIPFYAFYPLHILRFTLFTHTHLDPRSDTYR